MKKKISAKINGTQLFLLLVFAIYLILLLVNPSLFRESLMQFLRILREIITPFIVVFVLMFCFNLFLNKERMARLLGESSGLKGWIIAIIGGILSMGPIYIWYPLISELQKRGVRDSFIATFLYNRAIQLPLLRIHNPLREYALFA